MDKSKRRKRFQQKKRNHDKWEHRIKERKHRWKGDTTLDDNDIKELNKWASHGKLCSCSMCGNSRELYGPTIQERRSELEYNEFD